MTRDERQLELRAGRDRWAVERGRWTYVLDTFWQYDADQMLRMFKRARSLEELETWADQARDGMVAT